MRMSPCCGRFTNGAICCAIDPRDDGQGGRILDEPWCAWCGKNIPAGLSYCSAACSLSYHLDIADSWQDAAPPEEDPA